MKEQVDNINTIELEQVKGEPDYYRDNNDGSLYQLVDGNFIGVVATPNNIEEANAEIDKATAEIDDMEDTK